MKKYGTLVLLVLVTAIHAQPVLFSRCYGGSGNEERCFSTIDAPPGVIMTGRTNSSNGDVTGFHGYEDGWVVRTNSIGGVAWAKCYGGSAQEALMKTIFTADGNLLHVGFSSAVDDDVTYNYGATDFWVIKTDTFGVIIWQKSYGGSNEDCAYSAVDLEDGTYIIGGMTHSNDGMVSSHYGPASQRDIWVIKIDASDGHLIWERSYGGTGGEATTSNYRFFRLMNMIPYDSVSFAFACTTTSTDGDVASGTGTAQFWLVKADTSGAILFENTYGGSLIDLAYSLTKSPDGGFALVGASTSNDGDVTGHHGSTPGMYDYWIMKTDAAGTLQWQRSCGGVTYEDAFSVCATPLGYYILGRSESTNGDVLNSGQHGGSDYWVAYLDVNGVLMWDRCLGGTGYDEGTEVLVTSDGYLTCGGHTGSNDGDVMSQHGGFDFWLVKLFDVTNVQEQSTIFSEPFVFPNPGGNTVSLYDFDRGASVQIFNSAGQLVKTETGVTSSVDCSDLPEGVYEFIVTDREGTVSRTRWVKAYTY